MICDEVGSDTDNLFLHRRDVIDSIRVMRVAQREQPNEVYNLASKNHDHASFDLLEYVENADSFGDFANSLKGCDILGLLIKVDLSKIGRRNPCDSDDEL